MQSKVKRLDEQNLIQSNDYDSFVRFWTYGPRYKLREVSRGDFWRLRQNWQREKGRGYNSYFDVCWQVMTALGFRGLKEVNTALQRAEAMGNNALASDENEIFEGIAQEISADMLKNQGNYGEADLLIAIQLRCLQSNNPETRKAAALEISSLGNDFLDELRQSTPILALAVSIFCEDFFSNHQYASLAYNFLEKIAENLETLDKNLSRKKVRQDCKIYHGQLVHIMQTRKTRFQKLSDNFNNIKSLNIILYNQVFQKAESQFLQDVIDGHRFSLEDLQKEVDKFYSHLSEDILGPMQSKIKETEEKVKNFDKYITTTTEYLLSSIGFLVAPLILGIIVFQFCLPLVGGWSFLGGFLVWYFSTMVLGYITGNRIKSAEDSLKESLEQKRRIKSTETNRISQEKREVEKYLHF